MASSIINKKMPDCDETIEYWLFPHDNDGHLITDEIELEKIAASYLAHIKVFTDEYIWNNQSFSLHVKLSTNCDGTSGVLTPHIGGVTVVGDVLEDEWFIVYLLMTISKAHPRTVCRVIDSDGEFLLIEAADHLPTWVNPESASQRVYLVDGNVHLIPHCNNTPSTVSPLPSGVPSIMDAVNAVNNLPTITRASPQVNNAINTKIEGYPGKIRREQHICHVYVPVGVAALLREYPTLAASAVHAFCTRDVSDNKALRIMRHFPPETRVMTAVRLSKALYAQLVSRPYIPDPRTGWSLPQPLNDQYKAHLTGLKMACGFEILVCSAGGVTPASTPASDIPPTPTINETDLSNNTRWIGYKKSLSEKGYFRGELEGSKLYKELESNCRHFFLVNMMNNNSNTQPHQDATDPLTTGAIMIKLLTKVNTDYEFFKERETRLLPADDDNWLHITPDALEEMLTQKFGNNNKSDDPKPASEVEMMESLTTFLGHVSDMDGAEIPPELQDKVRKLSTLSKPRKGSSSTGTRKVSSARKHSGLLSAHPQHRKISNQSNVSEGSNASDMSSFSHKVEFNADSFTDALNNILDLGVSDDDYWNQSDEESSGMSSYGEECGDDGTMSRKSSNTSQKSSASRASSGVDTDLQDYMKQMEQELCKTTIGENLANHRTASNGDGEEKIIRTSSGSEDDDDDNDDEFDDVEDFEPVKVDMRAVRDLVKTYTEEKGAPGPATALLGSLGIRPSDIK